MKQYKTVDEFLSDQTPDKLEQITILRELILEAEPTLEESIKWNAPSYSFRGEYRITFNLMNKESKVKLVLHMGAGAKENKGAEPILQADEGLVEWRSDIRGIITFENASGIRSKEQRLKHVLQGWLAIPV